MKKIEVDESFLSLDCFRSSHSLRIVIYFKKYIKCAQIHLTFDIPYKDQIFKILVMYNYQRFIWILNIFNSWQHYDIKCIYLLK